MKEPVVARLLAQNRLDNQRLSALSPKPRPNDEAAGYVIQSQLHSDLAAMLGVIAAGIEIVDDRYVDYQSLGTPTLIADDFFDAGCVIGTPVRDWRALDIPALVGRTLINGVEVARGTARDVMGHPFAALAWLANSLIDRGQYLKRDEFVFTGSVVETRWINAGDSVTVEVDSLGTTTLSFLPR